MGRQVGISTEKVECKSIDGGKVSSAAVEKRIEACDMSAAGALLGAGYIVIAGIGENGRLSLPDKVKLMPPAGIYGVGVTDLYSGEKYRDLLSVGEDGLRLTNGHGLPSGREVLLRFD